MQTLPFQRPLRPEIPNVYGTLDYKNFRQILIKMDEILIKSGFEDQLISDRLSSDEAAQDKLSEKTLRHALRCNIARHLTGESYRAFSLRLADSTLFQWFTSINDFGACKATSKSSLERYEKLFDIDRVTQAIQTWLFHFSDESKAATVGLSEAIDLKTALMDSTCIKANIHFPVDWILLRDAARSLLKAISTIRAQGLKHRMIEPALLLKQMNKLCIQMTHARRKKDSKKQRKQTLREMKKLTDIIKKHAQRYHQLLKDSWNKTSWSEAQMQQVLGRLNRVLEQLPQAVKQAHDRIIGERKLSSKDKLLSLYDSQVDIMVRGKAGSEVEFGQSLLLAEQSDGLILDWELFSRNAPKDPQLLQPTIKRLKKNYGDIAFVSTDRAFNSAKNDDFLKEENIFNATCPRSPAQLKEKLKDAVFARLQTRRSQTEARIGIFKNVFLGKPLRSRIIENKRHAVNWCVLSHNLWVLSRKIISDEEAQLKKAA